MRQLLLKTFKVIYLFRIASPSPAQKASINPNRLTRLLKKKYCVESQMGSDDQL